MHNLRHGKYFGHDSTEYACESIEYQVHVRIHCTIYFFTVLSYITLYVTTVLSL